MSRYASTNSRSSNNNVNLAICSTVIGKEVQYRKGAAACHSLTKTCAERLVPGSEGALENALYNLLSGSSGDEGSGVPTEEEKTELQEFLSEQRSKLQKLSLQTAEVEMETDAFLAAMRNLREQLLAQSDQEPSQSASASNNNTTDFDATLSELIEKELAERKAENPPEDNEKYHDVCKLLGIEVQRKRNKATADDDIEEVRNTGTASQGKTQAGRLKCPITTMDMEDPVKNTQCGHVYSRKGIEQLMRQSNRGSSCQCPIAGCTNRSVTNDQLEKDLETEVTINRARRRQKAAQQQFSQSANAVESDED
ncbi:hypothetical protein ACA910_014560 [Epithemia clementina (nom. ined.)]